MWRAVERLQRLPLIEPVLEACERGESPGLASAKLKLVDGCNLRCFMCDYWKRSRAEDLTTTEVLRLLDDLRSLGCEKVHFTGGELFLRADAIELLERAATLGMRVNLTTNGTLLEKDRLRALLAIPPKSVTVSIDSPVAKLHDELRGQEGAFKRTTKALDRMLRGRRPKTRVRINTVVSARNVESLLRMPDFLRERPIDGWLLIPVDPKAGCGDTGALGLDLVRRWNEEIAPVLAERVTVPGFDPWVFGRTDADLALAARGEYARGHYREHRCWAPWFHVLVDARGDVYPCCMGHRSLPPLGNVRERPLPEIFHGSSYVAFRKAMLRARTEVCHRCDDFLPENRAIDERLLGPGATNRAATGRAP